MEMGVHAGGGQQHYDQCRQQPRHSSHVDAFLTSGASLKVQVCAQVYFTRPQKGKGPQHTLDSDNLCTCTRNRGGR
jgi:hypothetical protein